MKMVIYGLNQNGQAVISNGDDFIINNSIEYSYYETY